MGKKLYKGIILFLCLIIGILMFRQPGVSNEKEPREIQESEKKKVVLTLAMLETSVYDEQIQKLIPVFNQENSYGVEIEVKLYGMEEYKKELALEMAVNDPPDIFFTWEAGFFKAYAEKGMMYEIGKKLETDKEMAALFDNVDLSAVTIQDKIWALPTGQSLAWFYYNKDTYEKYGWQGPDSYQDFLRLCAEMKRVGLVPIEIAGNESWQCGQLFEQMLIGVGGKNLYEGLIDGTISWDDQRVLDAAEQIYNWYDKGYINEDLEKTTMEAACQVLAKGEAGMIYGGSWGLEFWPMDRENIGLFLMPAYNSEHTGLVVGSVENCFAISSTCKNVEGAFEFLKYLYTKEFQEEMQLKGYFPIRDEDIDTGTEETLFQEMTDIYSSVKGKVVWFDRILGSEEGEKINNLAQKILLGYDAEPLLREFAGEN